MTKEHLSAHILSKVPGIGPQKIFQLLSAFQSYEKIYAASPKKLLGAGLSQNLTEVLIKTRKEISIQNEQEHLEKNQISIILDTDKDFPPSLKQSKHFIPILYVRGNRTILHQTSVAIVGSRKFSPYGKHAASRLSFDIAQSGVHIVSGLALGIDGLAHTASLEANALDTAAGKTIAVLGGGIDDATIAPRTHVSLAHKILESGGALISTYPPKTRPSKGTFPARNTIMALLSNVTLVIEANKNSGTLITAMRAFEANKQIFAVPGSIFAPESVGTHELIAQGKAHIMCQASDILDTLSVGAMESSKVTSRVCLSDPEQAKIFKALEENAEGLSIDKIIRLTTLEGATVSQTLVIMEIDGIVMHLGGGLYSLK